MGNLHVLVPLSFLPMQAIWLSVLPAPWSAALACVLIILAGPLAPEAYAQMTLRLKWVWLSLSFFYLGFTPGESALTCCMWLTYEGVFAAAQQILHMMAMLAMISALCGRYSAHSLISGITQGLSALRLPVAIIQTCAVRLLLILQATPQPVTWQRWGDLVACPEQLVMHTTASEMTLVLIPLTCKQQLVIWLGAGVTLLLLFSPL